MGRFAAASGSMNDLMALALARRMLLELGYSMKPDASVDQIGALELWLHEPVDGLGGLSPLRVLGEQDGQEKLRAHLQKMLEVEPPNDLGSTGI